MMFRVLQRVVCALTLVLLAPILALVALLIVAESGLSVLFRQTRVGRNGVVFELLKFRSMRPGSGTQVTARTDPRITKVGRMIRKFKLDELPQLWNVVRGDMEVVGPRPEVPIFVTFSDPIWRAVLSMPPGITDLASLVYRNEEEMLSNVKDPHTYYRQVILPKKLALNVEYIQTRSPWTDLKLIVLTVLFSVLPQMDAAELQRKVCR